MRVENREQSNGILGAALMFGLGVVDFIDSRSAFGGCVTLAGVALFSAFLWLDKRDRLR